MAAELSRTFGIEAKLVEGDNGIFDVVADDELVFSKHKVGRFPENEEIVSALRDRESAST